jgi:hypothetical protein
LGEAAASPRNVREARIREGTRRILSSLGQAVEGEIARSIAGVYSSKQLPRYLEDSGVPERYLDGAEAQPKWEYVLSVLEQLHDGGSEARRVLREFVGGWLEGRHHDPPRPEIRQRVTALLAQQGWHVREARLVIGERTYDAAGYLSPDPPIGRAVWVLAYPRNGAPYLGE